MKPFPVKHGQSAHKTAPERQRETWRAREERRNESKITSIFKIRRQKYTQ